MKACLPVRAFAWKEVSTETLPDSCPDPLLFLLFSRRFPAPSLLLGLLRLHQIEQLLFRVDLKLGIEMPRMRRPGQHVLRALLRQPGLFRRPCPWLQRVRGQRHQRVSGLNPETSLSAMPLFQPLPYKKRPTLRLVFSSLHANGPCAFSSATNSQRRARFRCAGQPRGQAWRAGDAHAHRPCGCRRNSRSPTPGRAAPRASKFVPDA